MTSWVSAFAVLLYAVLIVCVIFPFGVWDRMWNSIGSVHDHCLFIYIDIYFRSFHIICSISCDFYKNGSQYKTQSFFF